MYRHRSDNFENRHLAIPICIDFVNSTHQPGPWTTSHCVPNATASELTDLAPAWDFDQVTATASACRGCRYGQSLCTAPLGADARPYAKERANNLPKSVRPLAHAWAGF
jgi:hypothetical protein